MAGLLLTEVACARASCAAWQDEAGKQAGRQGGRLVSNADTPALGTSTIRLGPGCIVT